MNPEKIEIGFLEQNNFQVKELFFENLLTDFGVHRDHPRVWELMKVLNVKVNFKLTVSTDFAGPNKRVEFHVPNGPDHCAAHHFFSLWLEVWRVTMFFQNLADDGRKVIVVFKEFF